MVQAAAHKQQRAQLTIFNVIEREGKERAAKRRLGMDDEHDPYAEDIIIDQRSGSVVIRDVGEEDRGGAQ